MEIRVASEADIPAIIPLLELSLGQDRRLRSEACWRWKHLDNPFGPSPVLLAEEGGDLLGVRAFMRWRWHRGDQQFSALRAVDTATHPTARGRGIFKKLTLQLVDACAAEGDHFIFNTPNEKSRPGYLKMGWRSLGRVPVRLRPVRLTGIIGCLSSGRPETAAPGGPIDRYPLASALAAVERQGWLDQGAADPKKGLHTTHDAAYLRWRYVDCPARSYGGITDQQGEQFLVIFTLKRQRFGGELRILDILTNPGAIDQKTLRRALTGILRALRPNYLSATPASLANISIMGFTPAVNFGPILTFRALQQESDPIGNLKLWQHSLGDLELF